MYILGISASISNDEIMSTHGVLFTFTPHCLIKAEKSVFIFVGNQAVTIKRMAPEEMAAVLRTLN
jgi:hypothetical protein